MRVMIYIFGSWANTVPAQKCSPFTKQSVKAEHRKEEGKKGVK